MAKGPKKVMLTPKEQALRVVRKPKAEKTVITSTPVTVKSNLNQLFESAQPKMSAFSNSTKTKLVFLDEQVPRQPFHNKGKNKKKGTVQLRK